jgi:hypothetical protein
VDNLHHNPTSTDVGSLPVGGLVGCRQVSSHLVTSFHLPFSSAFFSIDGAGFVQRIRVSEAQRKLLISTCTGIVQMGR